MNRIMLHAFLTTVCFLGTGCATWFQSNAIKQEAIKLDNDVLAFKAQKQSQVDTLNKTFQDTSDKLMDQLTTLCEAQLDLGRDLNSQAIADQAVLDPNKVLMPATMHDLSLAFINDQFKAIQAVDEKISAARTQYANSAAAFKVAIDQLTGCDTALKKLIVDNPTGNAAILLQDIEGAYNGVKTGIASTKGAGSSPKAPAVP